MFGIFLGGLVLCTSVAIILGKHSVDRRCANAMVVTLLMLLAGAPRTAATWTAPSQISVQSGTSHDTSTPDILPPPLSPKPLSSSLGRRQLVQLTTVGDLRSHLSLGTAQIELAEGTYELGGNQLEISHNVTIRAAPGATVILDGQGSSTQQCLVFSIYGGKVTLRGLSITGAYYYDKVSACIGP